MGKMARRYDGAGPFCGFVGKGFSDEAMPAGEDGSEKDENRLAVCCGVIRTDGVVCGFR